VRSVFEDIAMDLGIMGKGATAVVFVHGLGASRRCFDSATRWLDQDRYTLILPDLVGFGESEAPESFDYTMRSLARHLGKALESLGHDRFHVVAHSMGSAVALLLPEVSGLAFESFVSAEGNLVEADAFMSSKIARFKEATLGRVHSKLVRIVEGSLDGERGPVHRAFLESFAATPPHVLHRAATSCASVTASGELAKTFVELRCPRLYLLSDSAERERGIPEPVTQGGVPVVRIEGADHLLMSQAEAFYGAISDHLEAAGVPDGAR